MELRFRYVGEHSAGLSSANNNEVFTKMDRLETCEALLGRGIPPLAVRSVLFVK